MFSDSNMDSSAPVEIVRVEEAVPAGMWWKEPEQQSAWFSLTAGNHYYIELHHTNGWGSDDHAQVHLEISGSPVSEHNQARKEVQQLSITASGLVFDTTTITIENPDDDQAFQVKFTHDGGPGDDEEGGIYKGEWISTKPTASDCKNAAKGLYDDIHKTGVTATVELTDAAGATTTDYALATKIVCTIVANELMDHASARAYTITSSSTATITVMTGADNTASSLPFTGNYIINVPLPDSGVTVPTGEIDFYANAKTIEGKIWEVSPDFRYKLYVTLQDDWWWTNHERTLTLNFAGYPGNPGQWEIVTGSDEELEGPTSISFSSSTLVSYDASSLYYSPIPFDMIKTQHTNPQIVMVADNMPVACRTVDCDFVYVAEASEIASFSVSGNTAGSTLTINGADFPDSVKHIFFGNSPCSDETVTATQITCTLENDIQAGDWLP